MFFITKCFSVILLFFVAIGCIKKTSFREDFQKGPLEFKNVIAKKGAPKSSYQTPEKQMIYHYDEEFFQVVDGEVSYYYRKPKDNEETLQYWMNRWQNDVYESTEVGKNSDSHIPSTLYYVNYDNNERFIYNSASREVLQVIYKLNLKSDDDEAKDQ